MDSARRTGAVAVSSRLLRRAGLILLLTCGVLSRAQSADERMFPQSATEIEKILNAMHASMSGRLPVLDGFAKAGDHPLERYQRGFFQASAKVRPNSPTGSIVRIQTRITAWYADPLAAESGYQLLTSNGRIESDILDELAGRMDAKVQNVHPAHTPPVADKEPIGSSSEKIFSGAGKRFSASSTELAADPPAQPNSAANSSKSLQAEADSLEEILKNTAHPKNLVAVKKSGTPVVATPSLNAKPQFLASMHDEFELLDFNANWVHVKISGLSRGWIWRNSVEMPDGIPDTDARPASTLAPVADLYKVSREETAQFPGDWPALRDKKVKIISVQETADKTISTGLNQRLEYVKFLLQQNDSELAKSPQEVSGIVVIFDAADGGMIAATTETLQQWRSGTLTDAALWHACFFDPQETLDSAAPAGSK